MKIHAVDENGGILTFEASKGRMVVVELTENDRENIANMEPGATLYANADDDCEVQHIEDTLDTIQARAQIQPRSNGTEEIPTT